jgi:DNA-binding transcriptional MerR regulator
MNPKEMKEFLDERLDDESKAKMEEMLKKGIPLKEVLQQFSAQLDPPEEKLTAMEMKMKNITDGKDLSNYQIYELMKDQMDAESRKKMEEMLKNGCPLEEVIEHFMKKGKTKEQAQNEKSEQLRQKISDEKNMTPEDMIELLRADLGSEDRIQLEKMLKNGCSLQEVIDHFINRGTESDKDDKTEFQSKIEELMSGKDLNEDEILALMRSQVDDTTKAEIKAMLDKGYSKLDVINHLMKTVKTNEEKEKENASKLMSIFDDQEMSEDDKINMLEKQLNSEDQAQMAEMLKNGCTIEEIIGHFMTRSASPEKEKSDFAKSIEAMIEGKNMTPEEILHLIEEQLDDEAKQKMEEMLSKGYTKQDVINHFMKNAKTREEQMKLLIR